MGTERKGAFRIRNKRQSGAIVKKKLAVGKGGLSWGGTVAGEEPNLRAEGLVSIGYLVYIYWFLVMSVGSNFAPQL